MPTRTQISSFSARGRKKLPTERKSHCQIHADLPRYLPIDTCPLRPPAQFLSKKYLLDWYSHSRLRLGALGIIIKSGCYAQKPHPSAARPTTCKPRHPFVRFWQLRRGPPAACNHASCDTPHRAAGSPTPSPPPTLLRLVGVTYITRPSPLPTPSTCPRPVPTCHLQQQQQQQQHPPPEHYPLFAP